MNKLYVVGTDTGIGKTVFSTILMHYFYFRGFDPFYFKPFQTGCPFPVHPESDANFIYSHIKQLAKRDPSFSVGYCFSNPKAPYFAAKDEKKEIDIKWVKGILEERSKGHNPIIIEGSGGLLVPITRDIFIMDTIKIFEAIPILVARAGLGTINHTLLSLECLEKRGIVPLSVIFIDKEDTPEHMIKENMEAISLFSNIKVAGVIKKIIDFSHIENNVFALLDRMFLQSMHKTP